MHLEIAGMYLEQVLKEPNSPVESALLNAVWHLLEQLKEASATSPASSAPTAKAEAPCAHNFARLGEMRTPQHPELRELECCMNCDALAWSVRTHAPTVDAR